LLYEEGERSAPRLVELVRSTIGNESLARIDYVSLNDAETLEKIDKLSDGPALLSIAVFIGKTRLMAEFAGLAQRAGVVSLWGNCWEGGDAPVYWPWIQVLRAYGRGLETEDALKDAYGISIAQLQTSFDGYTDKNYGAIVRAEDLSGMPPVYLSTAGFDPLRDEGEELAARLRADGVPVVARRFAGLVHGYASFTAVSAAARDATLDAASALRAALALVGARRSARRRPSSAAG